MTRTAATTENKRNPVVEILRFVFCILIINYHFFSHY